MSTWLGRLSRSVPRSWAIMICARQSSHKRGRTPGERIIEHRARPVNALFKAGVQSQAGSDWLKAKRKLFLFADVGDIENGNLAFSFYEDWHSTILIGEAGAFLRFVLRPENRKPVPIRISEIRGEHRTSHRARFAQKRHALSAQFFIRGAHIFHAKNQLRCTHSRSARTGKALA